MLASYRDSYLDHVKQLAGERYHEEMLPMNLAVFISIFLDDRSVVELPYARMSGATTSAIAADKVNKFHAVCAECGDDGYMSMSKQPLADSEAVGGADKYMPLCRGCYHKRMKAGIK